MHCRSCKMSSPFSLLVLHLFIIIISLPLSCSKFPKSILNTGSSLSVEDPNHVLTSPNSKFSAGFYPVGDNAYSFAIWFSDLYCIPTLKCTLIWMANRDFPINGKRSKLSLLKSGNLVLTDAGKSTAWATNTASVSLSQLVLHDNGNLVLNNSDGVLWQSFDHPTHTLLPQQPFTRYMQLVSPRSESNFSSGFYKLFFDHDNVLRLLYDGPEVQSIYGPDPDFLSWDSGRSMYNSSKIAILDALGDFASTDGLSFRDLDSGSILQRRLKLDSDGNLRLYSRQERSLSWAVTWMAFPQPCMVHGICGPNSVCTYDQNTSGRGCSCLPGYKMVNHTDWAFGCAPDFSLSCAPGNAAFVQLPHVKFFGYDYDYQVNTTLEKCAELSANSCDCKGFKLKYSNHDVPDVVAHCFLKTLLLTGQRAPHIDGDVNLKVPKNSHFSDSWPVDKFVLKCSRNITKLDRKYTKNHGAGPLNFLLWFITGFGLVEFLGMVLVWLFLYKSRENTGGIPKGYLLATTGFERFTYSQLKKATKNFRQEIGRGAGGIVCKGVLPDHRVAAVKQLYDAHQGEAEYLAEISTIGKLNHMNLIEMWGYCFEGKHRLLVYEYMEHGSLAENLSSKALDWKKRYEIAVGTAKGLAYLHEECLEWVLHCDVKPQNILLDSNYGPKVSDFGLSRLISRDERQNSGFSRIRGTRGYMAPEWVYNLPITSKVDVYSYGIVVLEMITGKNPAIEIPVAKGGGEVEHRRLVAWIREKMKQGGTAMASWVEEITDPIIGNEYNVKKFETLFGVALQCVEEDKDARPTMSQVVETLLHLENHD